METNRLFFNKAQGVKSPEHPPFNTHIQAYQPSHLQLIPVKSSISNLYLRFAVLIPTSHYYILFHFNTLQLVRFSPNLDKGKDKIFSKESSSKISSEEPFDTIFQFNCIWKVGLLGVKSARFPPKILVFLLYRLLHLL